MVTVMLVMSVMLVSMVSVMAIAAPKHPPGVAVAMSLDLVLHHICHHSARDGTKHRV